MVRAQTGGQGIHLVGRANKTVVVIICLGMLLSLSACTVQKWCNDMNDYSTLQADLEHCRKEAGFMCNIVPVRFNCCMESLGWYDCADKPQRKAKP